MLVVVVVVEDMGKCEEYSVFAVYFVFICFLFPQSDIREVVENQILWGGRLLYYIKHYCSLILSKESSTLEEETELMWSFGFCIIETLGVITSFCWILSFVIFSFSVARQSLHSPDLGDGNLATKSLVAWVDFEIWQSIFGHLFWLRIAQSWVHIETVIPLITSIAG